MGTNPIDPADPAVIAAEKRCKEAHDSHQAYERNIGEIIAAQDWKTLGYNTFIEYWIGRFSDITETLDNRRRVVYAMLDEGGTNDAIADAVKGITTEGVANLRRQKASGVPAEKADAMRKPLRPKRVADKGTVFVHAGPELGAHWDAIAVQRGASTSELVIATMVQVHGRP
jgi:hypothetical protein